MQTLVSESSDVRRRHLPGGDSTALAIVAFLVVALLAESGTRILAGRIEDPQGWNLPGLAEHVENLHRLAGQGREVDVLFVGSSVVGLGLDPGLLPEVSASTASAYSLHGPGVPARSFEVLVEDLAQPLVSPERVVLGVSSRELNDVGAPQARQHEILQSSPELRRLTGRETPVERLERGIGRVSVFFRLRDVWRRPALLHRLLDRGPRTTPDLSPEGMDLEEVATFEARPAHLAQERRALQGFQVGGPELQALRQLIERLQRRGIPVVLVNMPVYEDVYVPLHPRGEADQRSYEQALAGLAQATGVAYVDGMGLDWGQEWFANENHLNRSGAARMTRLIAATLDETAGRPSVLR